MCVLAIYWETIDFNQIKMSTFVPQIWYILFLKSEIADGSPDERTTP